MISPECFCLGSENDPLKKQPVQHLGKEEENSFEYKIWERNSFTPLSCQGAVQTPVCAPLPAQEGSAELPKVPALWGRQGTVCADRRLGKQGSG